MLAHSFRASKTFVTLVVSVAIFTDLLLQNLVVPVLPFALRTRVGIRNEDEVQKWTAILLAASWGALTLGSRTFMVDSSLPFLFMICLFLPIRVVWKDDVELATQPRSWCTVYKTCLSNLPN